MQRQRTIRRSAFKQPLHLFQVLSQIVGTVRVAVCHFWPCNCLQFTISQHRTTSVTMSKNALDPSLPNYTCKHASLSFKAQYIYFWRWFQLRDFFSCLVIGMLPIARFSMVFLGDPGDRVELVNFGPSCPKSSRPRTTPRTS